MREELPLEEALLEPPRGYRPLAWLGLMVNVAAIPAGLWLIFHDRGWRIINITVGSAALLPVAIVGLVASIALLRWRHWGRVLAIIALALSLALTLPYTIVRLVMVEQGRLQLALVAPLLWGLITAALVFWCRPAIGRYLR